MYGPSEDEIKFWIDLTRVAENSRGGYIHCWGFSCEGWSKEK